MRPLEAGDREEYDGQVVPPPGELGYAVRYEDGYVSWSPKATFEAAYRPNGKIGFSEALYLLKRDYRLTREGWNGKGMRVQLYRPGPHSSLTQPFLVLCYPKDAKTTPGGIIPWAPSQADLLAEDWRVS